MAKGLSGSARRELSCGGSSPVFGQRAVCEAGDSARVRGDHRLPPKVGDPDPERQRRPTARQFHASGLDYTMTRSAARSSCCGRPQTEFVGSGFEHYCRCSFQRSSAMGILSSNHRRGSNYSR
jgi:hypothetical protein